MAASLLVAIGTFAMTAWIGGMFVLGESWLRQRKPSAEEMASLGWALATSGVAAVAAGVTAFAWLVRFYYTYDDAPSQARSAVGG